MGGLNLYLGESPHIFFKGNYENNRSRNRKNVSDSKFE
jgi:hypothetical protein